MVQDAARRGVASSFWSVGDAAPIELSGSIGSIDVTGMYKAVVLGFDHNYSLEGTNKIHFGIIKNSANEDVTFTGFQANSTSSNSGGYATSNLRTLMASFLSVIPEKWKNVMTAVRKYTDNIGGMSKDVNSITVTQDMLFILSAFEIAGNNDLTNQYEKSYQSQYEYYLNGNSKIKYSHQDPYPVYKQWTRSPSVNSVTSFCYISEGGTLEASQGSAIYTYGINPCFVVG